MVSRFVFSRQEFTLSFPYRRWKFTRSAWELLDSDVGVTDDLDINYEFHGETKTIHVREDCSMSHLRVLIEDANEIGADNVFKFVVDGKEVRARAESDTLCADIHGKHVLVKLD